MNLKELNELIAEQKGVIPADSAVANPRSSTKQHPTTTNIVEDATPSR